MYFLVEFDHIATGSESINGGPWVDTSETIRTNRLVRAATFIEACVVVAKCGEYHHGYNFRNLTLE
jgi:hypothetical protein